MRADHRVGHRCVLSSRVRVPRLSSVVSAGRHVPPPRRVPACPGRTEHLEHLHHARHPCIRARDPGRTGRHRRHRHRLPGFRVHIRPEHGRPRCPHRAQPARRPVRVRRHGSQQVRLLRPRPLRLPPRRRRQPASAAATPPAACTSGAAATTSPPAPTRASATSSSTAGARTSGSTSARAASSTPSTGGRDIVVTEPARPLDAVHDVHPHPHPARLSRGFSASRAPGPRT